MIENEKEDVVYNTYLHTIHIIDDRSLGIHDIIFFDINSDDVFKIRHLCYKYMIDNEFARVIENGRIYPISFIKKALGGLNGRG